MLQLQEKMKNFLTQENLEMQVQDALDSWRSYNWAISSTGLLGAQQGQCPPMAQKPCVRVCGAGGIRIVEPDLE